MLYYRTHGFWKLLRRVRWLLLFLILIFAFNIPGEYVRSWPFEVAPTYEGLADGLLQSARICIMLAGLALLLGTTHRVSLITGFYQLLIPLRFLKFNRERFAARLWLTLHYVDETPKNQLPVNGMRIDIFDHLLATFPYDEHENDGPDCIRLKTQPFKSYDWIAITALMGTGVYMLCA